jgi:hypothetical protein
MLSAIQLLNDVQWFVRGILCRLGGFARGVVTEMVYLIGDRGSHCFPNYPGLTMVQVSGSNQEGSPSSEENKDVGMKKQKTLVSHRGGDKELSGFCYTSNDGDRCIQILRWLKLYRNNGSATRTLPCVHMLKPVLAANEA